MRKWLIVVSAFIAIFLMAAYLFIPPKLSISYSKVIKGTAGSAYRFLSSENEWEKWWPKNASNNTTGSNNTSAFAYSNYSFSIKNKMLNEVLLEMNNGTSSHPASIIILPLNEEKIGLDFRTALSTTSNPINRISAYLQGKKIKEAASGMLESYAAFLEKEENIYGFTVQETIVKDTTFISIKTFTKDYPSTSDVYSLVKKLREYIKANAAKETNYPMLNIGEQKDGYAIMVAIPIDKVLKGDETFAHKRMVPGKIVYTEVKGGPAAVKKAWLEMENYVQDHKKRSPAIPFQMLVTDREKEPDTTKWITRIYYPIF